MYKTKSPLITRTHQNERREVFAKICLVAILAGFIALFATAMGATPVFADGDWVSEGSVSAIAKNVVGIIATAAKVIGAIIGLWGVIQLVLAMRREDSEGISKQIITIVVGVALVAVGFGAIDIFDDIMGNGGSGGGLGG